MKYEITNGTFGYKKDCPLLKNINLTIEEGEILAILGANGIGKTTLLKCMMGFLKWRTGESLLNGIDIHQISERDLWKQIAYVPQARSSAFPLTAKEMVLIGRSAHLHTLAQPKAEDVRIAKEALERVGIYSLRNQLCNQMSGGQLQLVLIARALATNPKLLILDEPESGLDFRNQLLILDIIKHLSETYQLSVIMNTHYPTHALKISQKCLILDKQCRYFYGLTREIMNVNNMQSAFGVHTSIQSFQINGAVYEDVIPLAIV